MEFERLRSEGVSAIGTLVCIRMPRSIKNGGRDRRDRPGGTILLSWTLPWTDDPHSVQASEVFSHAAQIPCLRLRQPSLTILSVSLTCNWPRNYSRAPGSSSGTRDDHAHDCRRGCQHREPRKRQCDHDLYGRELRAWM